MAATRVGALGAGAGCTCSPLGKRPLEVDALVFMELNDEVLMDVLIHPTHGSELAKALMKVAQKQPGFMGAVLATFRGQEPHLIALSAFMLGFRVATLYQERMAAKAEVN